MSNRYNLSNLTDLEYDVVRLSLIDSVMNSDVLSEDERDIASAVYTKMVEGE